MLERQRGGALVVVPRVGPHPAAAVQHHADRRRERQDVDDDDRGDVLGDGQRPGEPLLEADPGAALAMGCRHRQASAVLAPACLADARPVGEGLGERRVQGDDAVDAG
ncbi:MAG: hypothetical protein PGN11_17105 [Quadrisphaera sp.]